MTVEAARATTAAQPHVSALPPVGQRWKMLYPAVLAVIDFSSFLAVAFLAAQVQFRGDLSPTFRGGWYALVAVATPLLWVALMASGGGYRLGRIGLGADEYKSVFNSALRLTAL